ncbi:phosphotransferase [Catenulispora yoronensis]
MNLSQLGVPIGQMTRVHGGFANRMYRLDTDQGSFAVKELNLADRRWTYHVEDVFRFEQAAFAAGIPMPEPIAADHGTLVHRWVEGETVPEEPASAAFAFEIGEILARIHALDVAWPHPPAEEPTRGTGPNSPRGRWRPVSRGPTSSPPASGRSSRSPTSSTPASARVRSC